HLHDELAVLRELQDLIVGYRFEPGQPIRRTVISAEPHETFVVDMNAVLALRPLIPGGCSTPRLDVIPRRIEHDHRRRSLRRLLGLQRSRTMKYPDVVFRIDCDA